MSSEENKSIDPLEGIQRIGDTLVIPSDRYVVRKVEIQDLDRMSYDRHDGYGIPTRIQYEVHPRQNWHPPIFAASSGSL